MDDPREELERTRELLYVLMAERGEPEAFRWLVDRYEKRLLYFIRRSVDDTDRAIDVLQEVWMTVFRRIAALRHPRPSAYGSTASPAIGRSIRCAATGATNRRLANRSTTRASTHPTIQKDSSLH